MQSLISGAECATTSNPLSQVLKHTEGDRSIQRDRVGGPSSSRLHHLPHSGARPVNVADLAMARQFFDAQQQSTFQSPPQGTPRGVLEALGHIPRANSAPSPNVDSALWARSMNMPLITVPVNAKWSDEFSYNPIGNTGSATMESAAELTRPMNDHMPMYRPFFQQTFASRVQPQPNMSWDHEFDSKGKGKATDAQFEEAFARVTAVTTNQENGQIVEVQDDSETLEDAFARARVTDPTEKVRDTDGTEYLTDFQKVWDKLKSSERLPPDEDLARWESEFNQLMEAEREDLEFGEGMQDAWQNGLGNLDDDPHSSGPLKFDDEGIPVLEPYQFESNNPYLAEQTSHLAQAKQLLEQNGSLTEAALLLEAAIQQGELGEGGYEAWILLGETRSMDEREEAAMKALTEGVRRAQEADADGEGMLSLAISYTNESFDRASHATLHQWLIARFPALVPEELKGPLPSSAWASHDRATDAFLAVARQHHLQGRMDPDVQIGLGVLFYTNTEFDKAKDCFESALAARPRDFLLWNRLGSCLSNGAKPEEALGVYREALQLRPTYTRAIYNVGVACLNIGLYKEAAEHFLSGLLMQESTGGDKSEQLWQTLRKCFLSMDRHDLADRAKAGESLDTFKREGFEF